MLKCFVFTQTFIQCGQQTPIEIVGFLLTCLLRNAFFGRSAVIETSALTFLEFGQLTQTRRLPIKLSIKKRIFWSICGHPDFCTRFCNFRQPTRTRRFPIKLSIKKRDPDFCNHFFSILGSQLKLVDFLKNCLLRNAFFGRSVVIRTFVVLGSRPELVGFLLTCLLRNAFFGFLQFWAANSNSSISS